MAITGRPKKTICIGSLNKLCEMQATLVEIAGFFNVSEDTIERRVRELTGVTFAEYYKKASSGGKISLRRAQYKAALGGNITMLIWLGKQILNQRDTIDSSQSASTIVLKYNLDSPSCEQRENEEVIQAI